MKRRRWYRDANMHPKYFPRRLSKEKCFMLLQILNAGLRGPIQKETILPIYTVNPSNKNVTSPEPCNLNSKVSDVQKAEVKKYLPVHPVGSLNTILSAQTVFLSKKVRKSVKLSQKNFILRNCTKCVKSLSGNVLNNPLVIAVYGLSYLLERFV
ncbi:uncharacterized protein LOC119681748 [Teleopsis dalmanni]|uniref:uncharacterized protein LOC119678978 n=1 Tax=Teleopsis dalmanni TaxID=139649 RepID=UPI0018CD5469|nr:uncharacterized protein LOC119678978 [Teleopsis dalmanni]XP_037950950.1 uncharacterized protein LOC119681748 [Teleopsis dalmanni]